MVEIKILEEKEIEEELKMQMEDLKNEYPKIKYEKATMKYKPYKIKFLLITESPPYKRTKTREMKYFYFDNITVGDTLLKNAIESIFSVKFHIFSYYKIIKIQKDPKCSILNKIEHCYFSICQYLNMGFDTKIFLNKNFFSRKHKVNLIIQPWGS